MKTPPPFSFAAQSLPKGIYEHFKGNRYRVLGVARHSETLEEFVVYQQLYGNGETWVRPLPLFLEAVSIEGKGKVPRFRLISESDE